MLKLELVAVTKMFKAKCMALHNLSATVTPGLYTLIGPNGAGKTTLLRLITGISRPSSGSILLNGEDIREDNGRYKQRFGYLPQEFGFYPDMTGSEFLHYMSRLKGIPPELYVNRVEEVAKQVGLTVFMARKIGGWSGGLKRRLGIAQALLNDPDILILDEPMIGLDPQERLFFWNYFADLARERIVLISSNVVTDFSAFSDAVLVLVAGKMRFNGRMHELLELVAGKVWAAELPVESGRAIERRWLVSTIHFTDELCQVRIVNDGKPDIPGVQPTEPGVQDAYTYIVWRDGLPPKE